jgi:hypothetical protein
MPTRPGRLSLIVGALFLAVAGCGTTDDIGPTLPVSGTVTVDGKKLDEGAVVFVPDDTKGNKAKVSAQSAVKDGSYTLTSSSSTFNKVGAPAGWYKVTIKTEVPMGAGSGKVAADPKTVDPKAAAAPKGMKIAHRYTELDKTPLLVEVKPGGSYDLKAESK